MRNRARREGLGMDRIPIGKMAKLHCVSEKTLRLYQEDGLLMPNEVDPDTGYRYYSLDQSSQLDMITQLKAIGMPLKKIAAILKQRDIKYLHGLVEERVIQIDEQVGRLRSARKAAKRLLSSCDSYFAKPPLDEIRIEHMNPRRLLRFDIEAYPLDGGRGNASNALEAWERCLRTVKRIFIERDLPLALFYNVGCLVSQSDLIARNMVVSGAFILVDADFTAPRDMRTEEIPGGTYLAVYCDGMSTSEGGYRESQYLLKLLDIIEEKGYGIAGDYIGEVLAETPAFLYTGRDMMVKLQIPVIIPPNA